MSEPVLIGTSDSAEIHLDVGALVGSHLGIVANSGGGKSGVLRKVLDTLARYHPRALAHHQLAALAKVSTRSSQWPTNWSSFRNCTLVAEQNGLVKLTDEGIAAYGVESQPDDPDAILRFWQDALPPSVGKMLEVLVAAKGQALHRDEIADRAGASRTSSGLGAGLKELRDNGLILGDRTTFRAAEVLL